jgi:hypothetical protein
VRERNDVDGKERKMPLAFCNNGQLFVHFGNFRWASDLNGPGG